MTTKVLAIDWGYSFVKAMIDGDIALIPSVVSTGYDLGFSFGQRKEIDSMEVKTEEGRWFIGELAKSQGSIFHNSIRKDRYDDPAFDALIKATLGYLMKEDGKVKIVTGLPPKFYATHKPLLEHALNKTHNFTYRGRERRIEVKGLKIIPQLVGTGLDLLYTMEGTRADTKLHGLTFGIIDPGFGTTDMGVISKGEYKNNMVDTIRYNMHKVCELIQHELMNNYGLEVDQIHKVEESIRTGTINMGEEDNYDITHVVDWAKKTVANAIVNDVNSKWLQQWEINKIILTGGGGEALYPFMKELLNVEKPNDAQWSNVRGYYKLGKKEWS